MLGWRRFLWVALGGFGGLCVLLGLFVLAMNPYGNLPHLLFSEHVITDINQRFQYPALIRSRRFDSAVIGTSDARLLRPDALDRVFGGSFANLAMNAGTPWEQYRLIDLFLREVPQPRMLLMALDHVWCDPAALSNKTTFRGFPEWMYDDNRWNDFFYILNGKTVELGGRVLAYHLGLGSARFPAGYEVFTPPEDAYDSAKVRRKLWGDAGPHPIGAVTPPYRASEEERRSWRFPALAWLDESLTRFPGRVVMAYMPAHVTAQPVPGSAGAARESECKAETQEIARRHGVPLIDFRIASGITTNDDNYWDRLHYRLPIADRIVAGIERALETAADDPNGDWRYLTGSGLASTEPH